MYHTIVKRVATKNFERVNAHDYGAILKDCAADIHHRFGGHHALGGERHDRDALGRWFERLGRLCPTLKLTVRDVWVKGWPHNTTVDHSLGRHADPARRRTVREPRRAHRADAVGKSR